MFLNKLYRCQIFQGLVGPVEVVFHQPVSKVAVELVDVGSESFKVDEFSFQYILEFLIDRVVLRGSDAVVISANVQFNTGSVEILAEFRTVVGLNVLDLAL